jgi:hypothetical protein
MRTRSVPTKGGKHNQYYSCVGRESGRTDCIRRFVPRAHVDPPVLAWFEEVGLDLEAMRHQVLAAGTAELERLRLDLASAEREAQTARDQLHRVRDDYRAGRLADDPAVNAALWREERRDLEDSLKAAESARSRLAAQEEELHRSIDSVAADRQVLERLIRLRKAVSGAVSSAEVVKAARRALADLFQCFVWHEADNWAYIEPVPRDDAPLILRLTDGAQVAEYRQIALPPTREVIAPERSGGESSRAHARARSVNAPA